MIVTHVKICIWYKSNLKTEKYFLCGKIGTKYKSTLFEE